jgi:transposase-like protein
MIATGVDAAGHWEILGVDVASSEDGAGWLALPRPVRHRPGYQ